MNNRDTEAAFQAMTESVETNTPNLEPADEAVQALLDHFFLLVNALGPIDMHDTKARYAAIYTLTQGMKDFFDSFESLTTSDDVMVEGGGMIALLDIKDKTIEPWPLEEESHIYGRISSLYIGSIPDEGCRAQILQKDNLAENQELGIIPFGLCLELEDALLSSESGRAETVPSNILMLIPLNYSYLRLKKVV